MKMLSDYKGDEAIELWGDLLDPLTNIIGDKDIAKVIQSGQPKLKIAKEILKNHKEDAVIIMERIDPTPIDGLNIIVRLLAILSDIGKNDDIKGFFGFAEQDQTGSASIGSVTESTEGEEN